MASMGQTSVERAYYENDKERGETFEDYAAEALRLKGLGVQCFKSRLFQYETGENAGGVEFKLDERYRETGNLFIETHGRSSASYEWSPGGVFRPDNTWLYCIGDWRRIFFFFKSQLAAEHRAGGHQEATAAADTGKGFLLPHDRAVELAGLILECDPDLIISSAKLLLRSVDIVDPDS